MSENGNSEKSSLFQASAPVFIGSVVLIFSVLAIVWFRDVDDTLAFVTSIQNFIVGKFGWFYVFAVAVFIVFALGVAMSSMGSIRLGPDDSEPDFSTFSWFSMLFSAGMGIGIMFYGVAEPIMHYSNPPVGPAETVGAARQAMELAFFHWGLHAWAIYAVMGLSLAYFGFRQGLPLTVRSALYPIIGDRIHGWMGHVVDIFAVLGTMFGVATSLGLGVMQVNAGLSYLFGIPQDTTVQVILIVVITLMATTSVVSGINAGIRRLSEINLLLAVLLMLFVLVMGPTVFLLTATVQNTGAYLSDLVNKTFTLYAYQPNEWIGNWTLFYWGWWISWSPFVGMFIARVSRGRTIREFVIGVLLVPSAFTFLWFTVFGNTALELQMAGTADIVSAVNADVAVALFKFLENLPFASISMGLATILVVTFFVTSSDSGSLVIDIITSGGQEEPPVWQRIFWALTEGVVAALLLPRRLADGGHYHGLPARHHPVAGFLRPLLGPQAGNAASRHAAIGTWRVGGHGARRALAAAPRHVVEPADKGTRRRLPQGHGDPGAGGRGGRNSRPRARCAGGHRGRQRHADRLAWQRGRVPVRRHDERGEYPVLRHHRTGRQEGREPQGVAHRGFPARRRAALRHHGLHQGTGDRRPAGAI